MSKRIDLTPYLRFPRLPNEPYTLMGIVEGRAFERVFEPGEPLLIPANAHALLLSRGRCDPNAVNLLSSKVKERIERHRTFGWVRNGCI